MQDYSAPADLLKNRIILVTGAGDGIGRCAAKTYAAHGATVILLGRTISKLEAIYDEIEAAGYPQPAIVPLNLDGAVAKDYEDVAMTIEESFGRLDGILHNAALLGQRTPVEMYDPATWDQIMRVNVTAPFLLTRALIPALRQSSDASIVFTSSSVGRKAKAYWGAYSVSKFALEGLSQLLADELDDERHNVRVNSLNPGATRTNMRAHAYPAENPASNPTPEDIMPAYLYLMGPDSAGVTGQQLDAR
ncbi:MAG: YciK family oxidoreductase [Alteromonadaceae bacterium]|uniref:YciK family oxidoreductase n=1 Tax=Marinobacter sp. BGYM27 TaxID=2975597 RepID=UPI000C3F56EB|nr:YciK family oxidoreductase [Marinobacter sp. BGYM27]MAA64433.1 YciK family oxidoreductase [Alteromonadaceae bacterium]MBH85925.1 YciK family oxidoreductase [Alteromonadaceae bacterium]MDG5498712.1 YciK family oxidoreductase [Marinobacter sp. BGYM27]|tara:strand:+ start:40590 stop:41333 length:744 start_codon:yes stop_codon:yes gene_type:complete